MNLTIITLARMAAVKAVKRDMRARGLMPAHVEHRTIVAEANTYLRDHPELLEQAAETVRLVPQIRTLAERIDRKYRAIQR